MATAKFVDASGALLIITNDDGSRLFAYPTPTKQHWSVSGGAAPPEPSGEWQSPMGASWPTGQWTTYTGEPSHDAGAIDFGTGYGGEPPLYAPCDGQVVRAEFQTLAGNHIVIKVPGENRWIAMLHLNRMDVGVGDTVTAGEQIGLCGWTGNVSPPGPGGAHLHLEVRTQLEWGAWVSTAPYFASKGVTL